ncbi:site-specific integrase [Roseinatronobacter ekhonensis]|uniref:site-specific integrase n=1 Tax=Roseinatronobacter ekhonensis TaxID=254356 RepID=UPI0015FF5B07|nr:tyrosine-type recombinase/integrase [Roseibaca ekhonensis]
MGIVKRRHRHIDDLSPAWRDLWKTVLAMKDQTLSLALPRFVHFLSAVGVEREDVTQESADAFLAALERDEISKSPTTAWRTSINAWNLAARRIAGWPQIELTLPRRQKICKRPDADLPPLFLEDLEAHLERMSKPDIFAEESMARALRPHTIQAYRRQLKRFVSELLNAGVPTEELCCVSALCDPARAEIGLRRMVAQNGGDTNKLIAEIAALLRNLSSKLGLSTEVREQLAKLAKRVAVPAQKGMTRKNRERLRPLQDDKTLLKLLNLPDKVFARAKGKTKPYMAALARETALAIALLTNCPLRIKNIAEINLEQHLQHMGDGRVFLLIEEEDAKTRQPMQFELPKDLVHMLKKHLATRSPHMCAKGSVWLFPRRDGEGPITGNALSARLKALIRKEVGILMNAHLFRHLAALMWLDANPGCYEVARRILGHSSTSHTINLYSGLEAQGATQAFAALLAQQKGGRS